MKDLRVMQVSVSRGQHVDHVLFLPLLLVCSLLVSLLLFLSTSLFLCLNIFMAEYKEKYEFMKTINL